MPQYNTSSFGRGWIPGDRDIGLPGESPLPPAGGAGGGHVGSGAAYPEHALPPAPSRWREGEPALALPFTPDRRVRFLHHLATTGNVRRACAAVGVSPQSAYVHTRRDPAFAAGWDAALLLARDAAEEVLAERALNGTLETIFYRGEAVGSRVRFDARLLLAHLARLDSHHEQAEAAQGIAARFDDYLEELSAGEPVFHPLDHDPDGPPHWAPAHPTREEALRRARERALHAFPKKPADLTAEMLADLDCTGLDPYDTWSLALAHQQARATNAAAARWDDQAESRRAALDTLLETDEAEVLLPEDPPHFCEAQMAEPPLDPPHFCEAQMGRGTARAAGGGGVTAPAPEQAEGAPPTGEAPPEIPWETKAAISTQDCVNPVNRAGRGRAGQNRKSSAVSTPPVVWTRNAALCPSLPASI